MVPSLEATPCPSSSNNGHIDIWPTPLRKQLNLDDATSHVDFTSAFGLKRPDFPRRTRTNKPRRPGKALDFVIHSDDGAERQPPQRSTGVRAGATIRDQASMLAQPAQRPRPTTNNILRRVENDAHNNAGKPLGRPEKTSSPSSPAEHWVEEKQARISKEKRIRNNTSRRETVYIPSDDTTMPTMWMGVFNPARQSEVMDGKVQEETATDLTGIAARMVQKRPARKSLAGTAPRRTPLTQARRVPQEKVLAEDVAGQLTGKENLPPGHEVANAGKAKKGGGVNSDPVRQLSHSPLVPHAQPWKRPRQELFQPGHQPAKKTASPPSVPLISCVAPQISKMKSSSIVPVSDDGEKEQSKQRSPQPELPVADMLDNGSISASKPRIIEYTYPRLTGDLQDPALHEDNWLHQQEIAITQVVNNLFQTAQEPTSSANFTLSQTILVEIYQESSMVILYKRLQASLLYGSLSVPKEIGARSARLADDLAMKQNFLNLWLNTYHLGALRACAAVVTGRQFSDAASRSKYVVSSSASETSSKTPLRQSLARFLEKFFIHGQDRHPSNEVQHTNMIGMPYTVLRSLMLVKLLDCTKTLPSSHFGGCLFQVASRYKSSAAVIQALAKQLLPCIGNALRTLSHLDYVVTHEQDPLDEYNYRLDNLAVDLRDGVRLARLMELLIYHSGLKRHLSAQDLEASTTTTLTTGEGLDAFSGQTNRPLSQQLKLPCVDRGTKLYNCQVALRALKSQEGLHPWIDNVQAEDIVDGFREKTLALLWGLAGRYRLGIFLVDWEDVKREIRRMEGVLTENDDSQTPCGSRNQFLLQQWATCVGSQRGVVVGSFSTSFADGRVFEAIVDEYEQFLVIAPHSRDQDIGSERLSLHQRLTALGCSEQFGKRGQILCHICCEQRANLTVVSASLFRTLPSSSSSSSSASASASEASPQLATAHNTNYVKNTERYCNHQHPSQSTSQAPESESSRCTSNTTAAAAATICDAKNFADTFTITALAFLASRLLSASRPARAATLIQHTWRRYRRRRHHHHHQLPEQQS